MKRVQVFKKTLLSVAVVTALGGNISLSYSADAQESMKISETLFQKGVEPGFWVDVARKVVKFGQSDDSKAALANKMRSALATKEAAFKQAVETFKKDQQYTSKEQAVEAAKKALKDAKAEEKEAKQGDLAKAESAFNGVKSALADKEKELINVLVKDLNQQAGVNLFEIVAKTKSGDDPEADPKKPAEPQSRAKPQEKVVAPTVVSTASASLDGAALGANTTLVMTGADEKASAAIEEKVAQVVSNIDKKTVEEIKPLFLNKKPVKGGANEQDSETWAAAPSARISNVDLTNDAVREALFSKVRSATDLGGGKGSVVDLSGSGLSFKNDQLELAGVHNALEGKSVIADVSSSADVGTDPAGSYVLTGEGSLYHKDIGKKRALKEFKVEGQQAKVQGEVKAQHVTVGAGGSLSGYSIDSKDELDKDNKPTDKKVSVEKAAFVSVKAVMPSDALLKNDKNDVVGRQNSTVNINSDEVQHANVTGYEVVNFSGKEWRATEIDADQVNLAKGEVIFEKAGDTDPEGIKARTLNVAEGVVVKAIATETIPDPKDEKKLKEVVRNKPVKIDGGEVVTRQGQVSKDGGKTWEDDGDKKENLSRDHVVDGTVYGNFENIDSLVVNGTLISDSVGSSDNRLKKFTLGKEGKVTRFSNQGNTIYTGNEAEYVISAGQQLVNDVDGFKSFKLDGGLFEGNLTPSAAAENAEKNKDAFQGSAVTLTSGIYQGGTIKSDKAITIDGDVVFKPGVTKLESFDDKGGQVSTVLKPIVLDADVLLTSSARPVVHKTYKVTGEGNKASLATPVQWGKNATMEKGAELPVSLDMSERAEDSAVPFVNVAETLTVDGNVVRATIDGTDDYEFTRNLYQEKGDNKGKDFAIVDAKEIKGEFGAPVSSTKLLKATGVVSDKDGRQVYGLNVAFNQNVMSELRQEYSLNDQQVVVVNALEEAALTTADKKAGKEVHDQVKAAVAGNSVKQFANQNTQNNVINGGLAQSALTVHRKVNENISRRLDRSRTGISSGDMFESQGFWGQYFYSDGKQDSKGDVLGFDSKVNGITIGVDADLNPDLTAGFAFSYAKSKLNTKGVSGETKSDTYMGSVYAGWNNGPYFLDGMLSYAGSRNDLQRATYKADSVKGSMWGARAVGGYMHQIQQWSLQPQVEFNYSSFKLDEFTESAGSLGQRVKINDTSVMELGAGMKVFGEFDAGRGTLKPEASLMAYHDFKDDKPAGSYSLAITQYNQWLPLNGSKREQNRYAFGLGGSYVMDNNLSLGLNYDYNWSGDFKAHGFMARISYDF